MCALCTASSAVMWVSLAALSSGPEGFDVPHGLTGDRAATTGFTYAFRITQTSRLASSSSSSWRAFSEATRSRWSIDLAQLRTFGCWC